MKSLLLCGLVLLLCILQVSVVKCSFNRSFTIDYDGNTFLKDGEPFRYVSGSVHYFRMVEQYWDDILRKMHLGGLNAIQTYIDWSSHQPTPEENFNFEGNLNLFKFLDLAKSNDLLVILRTGPFMDAERDMGGLPPWLLWQKQNMKIRTSDLEYVYFVSRWFDHLLPRLKPYLYENGGPIISVQVENEYGSYGCDKNYTTFLRDLIRLHLGDKVVLFTTDGSGDGYLKCGAIPDVYPTVDFGTASASSVMGFFAVQRRFAPKGPLVNSEFYPGWLDHWGSPHSTVGTEAVVRTLDTMLGFGANVNIYMFYGGTSFGFGAGSNADSKSFTPCPTSYDYDAPLSEAGDPTEKYFAIKDTIRKYMSVPVEDPIPSLKGSLGKIYVQRLTTILQPEIKLLFGQRGIESSLPLSFEDLKLGSGFVVYETTIDFMVTDPALLVASDLKDRAYIYVDELLVGVMSRAEDAKSLPIFTKRGVKLSIAVENQGRPCYGSLITESKGLGSTVTLGGHLLTNWTMWKIGKLEGPLLTKFALSLAERNLSSATGPSTTGYLRGSGIYYGNFSVYNETIRDTFVRLDGWTKGFIWINGFNLGRYWPVVGPQETLYLPAPLLKQGKNTVVILELESAPSSCPTSGPNKSCYVTFTSHHVINASTPLQSSSGIWKSWGAKHRKNPLRQEFPPVHSPLPLVKARVNMKSGAGVKMQESSSGFSERP